MRDPVCPEHLNLHIDHIGLSIVVNNACQLLVLIHDLSLVNEGLLLLNDDLVNLLVVTILKPLYVLDHLTSLVFDE